jgi:hypothetical protein
MRPSSFDTAKIIPGAKGKGRQGRKALEHPLELEACSLSDEKCAETDVAERSPERNRDQSGRDIELR